MRTTILFILSTLLLISGCAGMQWYKGAVIEYTKIEKQEDNRYLIEVLGSSPHSIDDLKSAALEKASELCGTKAELLETHTGTYQSGTVGGGVVFHATNPKISSIAKCTLKE